MTNVLTEGFRPGEYLVSEAEGFRSREQGVLLSGQVVVAGAVLGRLLHAGVTAGAITGTGNGVLGTITVGAAAKPGAHILKITKAVANAGDFELIDPLGEVCGIGSVGQAFAGGGLAFTLADGATDFAVGDAIVITVAVGSGKYVALDLAGTDGRQHAAAIAYAGVDASAGDRRLVVTARDTEANAHCLTWPAGITTDQITAARAELAGSGIIVRD